MIYLYATNVDTTTLLIIKVMLKGTSITITETLPDTFVSALDLAVILTLTDVYSFKLDDLDWCFKVLTRTDKNTLTIEWIQLAVEDNPDLKPAELPTTITELFRGFTSPYTSLYDLNFLNKGYLDIDNIVFDMFFKQIYKWDWLGDSSDNEWETKTEQKYVDFFFHNKRPITRQPYAEKTLGASDNVDLTWQSDKETSNPSSIITHPFMVFEPLGIVPSSDEFYRVEEFYNVLTKVPQEYLDENFNDIEIYSPPQINEFSYQVTAVTDSWKDARLLQAHMYRSLIPKDRGERYATFPSGMTHTVKAEMSDIVSLEEEGVFEVAITYTFYLPLSGGHPELTFSWVADTLNVTQIEQIV
jgi:hypothetical protein